MIAIKAETIFTPYLSLKESYVIIDGCKIVGISKEKPKGIQELHSYEDCLLAPGLVDVHTHGGFGIDVMNASPQELSELASKLPMTGVTSFFPSTVTDSFICLKKVVENIREAHGMVKGAEILGLHLEGPYLDVGKRGAHPVDYIRLPSFEEFSALFEASEGLLKKVTVAPEVTGGIEFICKAINKLKVTVSIGHTNATFDQAIQAFDSGVKVVVHLFNGMREFNHREPGVVGAALARGDVFTEAIVDLVHLHPATVKTIFQCKGSRRMLMITDAITGAGLPDGSYTIGPIQVTIKDGISRLPDGALAGSTLTMIKAVQNAVKIGIPIRDALIMATDTPCKTLGIRNKGRISPGLDADLMVLDKELNVVSTYLKGKKYQKC